MKKSIIIGTMALVAIVTGTNNANAQMVEANVGQTTVNIHLADVISIDAGSAAVNGTVNFYYETVENYNSRQNWNVPNSLIVTSTRPFDIKVKADGENFISGNEKIPVSVLTVKPVVGGTTTMNGIFSAVNLSTTNQNLVSSAVLGSKVILDLDYEIPAAKSSSSDILGKPAGTYTQTITYTATAL